MILIGWSLLYLLLKSEVVLDNDRADENRRKFLVLTSSGANSDSTKKNGKNNESRELGMETKTSTPEVDDVKQGP